jgi:hypothetical protein
MAIISGSTGTVSYGATPTSVAKLTAWTLEQTQGVLDVTNNGSSAFREKVADGFTSWSGSFEAFFDSASTLPTVGSDAALNLTYDGTDKWSGDAIITGRTDSIQVAGGDAVKVNFTFEGSGTLTATIS